MTPTKSNLTKLVKHFETFILSRNESIIDFDNPINLELDYVPDWDEAIPDPESPSYHILINEIPIEGSLSIYNEYIEAAVTEFKENIKMPFNQDVKIEYLKQIKSVFEDLDANIVENDPICISKNAICNNFTINNIEGNLKEGLNEYFYRLKQKLRDAIVLIHKSILEYNIEFDSDSVSLPFKRIRIKADINLIATLFYDLLEKKYIDTSTTNLKRFIVASFLDEDRQSLRESTINTYLKPGREDKRSSNDKRITIPPR